MSHGSAARVLPKIVLHYVHFVMPRTKYLEDARRLFRLMSKSKPHFYPLEAKRHRDASAHEQLKARFPMR